MSFLRDTALPYQRWCARPSSQGGSKAITSCWAQSASPLPSAYQPICVTMATRQLAFRLVGRSVTGAGGLAPEENACESRVGPFKRADSALSVCVLVFLPFHGLAESPMALIGARPRDLVQLVERPLRLDKVGLDRKSASLMMPQELASSLPELIMPRHSSAKPSALFHDMETASSTDTSIVCSIIICLLSDWVDA